MGSPGLLSLAGVVSGAGEGAMKGLNALQNYTMQSGLQDERMKLERENQLLLQQERQAFDASQQQKRFEFEHGQQQERLGLDIVKETNAGQRHAADLAQKATQHTETIGLAKAGQEKTEAHYKAIEAHYHNMEKIAEASRDVKLPENIREAVHMIQKDVEGIDKRIADPLTPAAERTALVKERSVKVAKAMKLLNIEEGDPGAPQPKVKDPADSGEGKPKGLISTAPKDKVVPAPTHAEEHRMADTLKGSAPTETPAPGPAPTTAPVQDPAAAAPMAAPQMPSSPLDAQRALLGGAKVAAEKAGQTIKDVGTGLMNALTPYPAQQPPAVTIEPREKPTTAQTPTAGKGTKKPVNRLFEPASASASTDRSHRALTPEDLTYLTTKEQKLAIANLLDRIRKPGVDERPATWEDMQTLLISTYGPIFAQNNQSPGDLAMLIKDLMGAMQHKPSGPRPAPSDE